MTTARDDQTPSTELPPRYDAQTVQEVVAKVWEEEKLFHAEPSDPGEPFSIVIPPPNVTAALHLGHALNNTIQDILVRRARMQGKNAVWIPGTDHAGIATQTVVDKRLKAEGKPALKDYKRLEAEGKNGREQFVEKVQAWKDEYETTILGQLRAMGCSCDWDRTAFTMDEQRVKAVREAFFRLFKDGLIYRGKRLVNWDPVTQTALADDEVENEEIDGHFYYLKYPLADGSGTITVATTRPETMLGDTAVAMNPRDPRAASLRGKSVRLPIVDREIPIVEDDYVVMPGDESDPKAKFATGFLKITPAHDPNDWEIGQRHDLGVINVMAPDASISDAHGWTPETEDARAFVGQSREDARKAIVQWFKAHDLLEEIKPYRHSVGHSYRSHVPVEPYLSDQWYVAVQKPIPWMQDTGPMEGTTVPKNSLAGLALTALIEAGQRRDGGAAGDGALAFVPDRYAKTFHDWNANLRDWCISRQLWWGHRIPVWSGIMSDEFGGRQNFEELATGASPELQATIESHQRIFDKEGAGSDVSLRPEANAIQTWINLVPRSDAAVELIERVSDACIGEGDFKSDPIAGVYESPFHQDPDVLDTWFSSALWPMSTLGWPENTAALEKWNPTSVLCTAREIITLWVSRMVMFNRYLLAHPDESRAAERAPDVNKTSPVATKMPGVATNGAKVATNKAAVATHKATVATNEAMVATKGSPVATKGPRVDTHEGMVATNKPTVATSDSVDASAAAGPVPFFDVFIHAMIQDGEGRKMSKSLGNGVDPLDIIATHGADAMRFTLAQMTTQTQDVRLPVEKDEATGRNTSPKFDLGRNFANKLWNAGRFVIGGLRDVAEETGRTPFDETKWSVVDRWILSRLARTVDNVNKAIDEYRFDRYATACYDFFWRDFCDWYVEASKPRMRMRGSEAAQTAHILSTCLDVSLRLMHPMIPFATERLWWALNDAMPVRGIPGRFPCESSERCIRARWPGYDEGMDALTSGGAERVVERLQEIVQAIRTVRTENKVEPRRTVHVTLRYDANVGHHIASNKGTIELWAGCEIVEHGPDAAEPGDAARTTAAGCEIFVSGVVDVAAEAGRIAREKADLEKKVQTLRGRLSNKGYTEKAPAHLVQQTRDELASAEADLAKL